MNKGKRLHRKEMVLTDLAIEAGLRGERNIAGTYFEQAYRFEPQAAELIAPNLAAEPTRSVLLRSVASLAMDC